MLNDITTSITEVDLDKLFEGASDTLPTANDLKFGKQADSGLGDVPVIDLEDLDKPIEEEKKEEVEIPPVEGEVKDIPAEEKKEEKEEKKEEPALPVSNEVLKNSVNFLVEKGVFKDFEGREDLDVDDETFAQLLEAQLETMAEERYEAKKLATGDYGQAIIDYIEKGGDADQIIDLFKEQQAVQKHDISTEDSQKDLITQYYKEVHEWSPKQIKRHLDTLSASEEEALQEEATDIKGKYEQHYLKQVETLKAEQEEYKEQLAQQQKQYETSLKSAIKDYEVDDSTKKRLESALFKTRTLDNGQKVNDFYLKFAEMQKDPKEYIKFVEYVMERDNLLKRIAITEQNKSTKKVWSFIKQGAAVSKTTGSSHTEAPEKTTQTGPDFKSLMKRK